VQVAVPTGNRVVLGEEILGHEDAPSEYDWGELSILNSQAGILPAQLDEGVAFGPEEIHILAEFAICGPLVVGHVFEELLTPRKRMSVSLIWAVTKPEAKLKGLDRKFVITI
jgi:hypothetical protein